jgi:sulfite reductase (NADPH) flavoprotein alpha-component
MTETATAQSPYSKDNPFRAHLTVNRLLNGEGSAKETRHFEVDVGGSGLTYACGDSLGVYPTNRAEEMAEVCEALGADPSTMVRLPKTGEEVTLQEALSSRLALAGPTPKFLKLLAEKVTDEEEKTTLAALLEPEQKDNLKAFLAERQFIDLLVEFPSAKLSAQELVDSLRKLMPRLYSIASSPLRYPDEIHLTIAVVRYETNRRERVGVASSYLADRVPLEDPSVPVFVASSHFGIPEDPSTDMIMVGPGTGVAPFRSFVQEQVERKGTGRSWLFFGDQHEASDFLYREEWENHLARGELTRLDCAWSRDQAEKVYVQDKMRESAAEIWKWLEGGASFFVCGDAKRMAKDVDVALHEIAATEGGLGEDGAKAFVKQLKKDKRYQRDVY